MARLSKVAFLLMLAARAAAAEPPDWNVVSAIFVERCVMCHSATHGAGLGLRLDTYEAAIAGSTKGVVLVPRDAAGSELIRRLRGESAPRMPFLGRPLPPEEIDVVTRWVEAGLPDGNGHSVPPNAAAARLDLGEPPG
jgi:hypothetical protein